MRVVRIGQPERLHRAMPQRLAPALRHHLDRQAAVEIGRGRFPFVEGHRVGFHQCVDEDVVLGAVERAIDVIGAGPARPGLVVARLEPGDRHVDGFAMHDRRDGIEKGERILAARFADRIGKRGRGEGPGRNDDVVPVRRRQAVDLAAFDADQRMAFRSPRLRRRKTHCGRPQARRRQAPDERPPTRMMSEPSLRSSSCRRPTALVPLSSERKELEQTSSASASVRCAAVARSGRISWSYQRGRRARRFARPPRSRRGRRR